MNTFKAFIYYFTIVTALKGIKSLMKFVLIFSKLKMNFYFSSKIAECKCKFFRSIVLYMRFNGTNHMALFQPGTDTKSKKVDFKWDKK